jgi:hypothetical protein
LQWLAAAELESTLTPDKTRLVLTCQKGEFSISMYDLGAQPFVGEMISGQSNPPRGWISRYYGEKVAAPSFSVAEHVLLPWSAVTLLSAGQDTLNRVGDTGDTYKIVRAHEQVCFSIVDGIIDAVHVDD